MTMNPHRRDFLRRSLYLGLSLGLPGSVLASNGGGLVAEFWNAKCEQADAQLEAMERLFRECMKGEKPDIILAGDAFMESHGQAFIDAGYAHEVVSDE